MSGAPLQFESIAEDALLLRFGDHIAGPVNDRVHAAVQALKLALPQVECVPAYASVLLRFDPGACCDNDADPHQRLRAAVQSILASASTGTHEIREHLLPVCYGGVFGPDLQAVAEYAALPIDEVIARHVAASYRVAMIGFAPGFPYLLGLDPALAMPRRGDPRQRVPAGSVAIGGSQTGIYPDVLPGGWQLIGRTPWQLFDASAARPSRLAPGDRVRLQAIDAGEFASLAADAAW